MAFEFNTPAINTLVLIVLVTFIASLVDARDSSVEQQPRLSYLGALNGSPKYVESNNSQPNKVNFKSLVERPQGEYLWPKQPSKPKSYFEALLKPPTNNPLTVGRNDNGNNQDKWRNQYEKCSFKYGFDYIKLSLQWAPGYCETSPKRCERVVNMFTIHGMWPNRLDNSGPENCCYNNVFDYSKIKSLVDDLDKYWFSYFGSSYHFWAHEWEKHGTCARDVPALKGEEKYFGSTLDLVKKMHILETLSAAGIVPKRGVAYQTTNINRALTPITGGKSVEIDCDYEHTQEIPIMKGLDFCFDSQLKFVDCPSQKQRCSDQVYFFNQ